MHNDSCRDRKVKMTYQNTDLTLELLLISLEFDYITSVDSMVASD